MMAGMDRPSAFFTLLLSVLLAGCAREAPFQIARGCPQFPPSDAGLTGGPMGSTTMGEAIRHAPPTRHLAVPTGPIDGVKITLGRSECLGKCPSYKVELRGNGDVLFHGVRYVNFAGDHRTRVSQSAIRCLLDDFRFADFWSLDNAYEAPVTDYPGYTLTLTIGGRTKTVTDYAGQSVGMPATVGGLELAIDQAAQTAMWIKGNDRTIAALEAERFDFRGPAAANLLASAMQDAPDALVNGLLDRGAPINGRSKADDFEDGFSTVEVAAREGRLALLRRLIMAGAFRDGGQTLVSATLRASVASQRAEIVAEVLNYHPEINSIDKRGDTALALIFTGAHPHGGDKDAPNDDVAIIRTLGRAGANPNLPTSEHDSLIGHAYSTEYMRALLAIGADLEKRDAEGRTPLLATNDEDTALELLKAGANPMVADKSGQTFIEVAKQFHWSKVVAAIDGRIRK